MTLSKVLQLPRLPFWNVSTGELCPPRKVCPLWRPETTIVNLHAEYIMRNAGLDEAQAGIKIARRNINNLRYADNHPYGRKQKGTKDPLDEGERGK